MPKYQLIKSYRLQGYDYGATGAYFITICTNNRVHFFGEIQNKEMHLNKFGQIIAEEWKSTSIIRKDEIFLGEWIIMPNHFHAIVIIISKEIQKRRQPVGTARSCSTTINQQNKNSQIYHYKNITIHFPQKKKLPQTPQYKNHFGPQKRGLATIINGFKSACTKKIRNAGLPSFKWQPRYHDHIIRNANEFHIIQNYILSNPSNWKEDTFYK